MSPRKTPNHSNIRQREKVHIFTQSYKAKSPKEQQMVLGAFDDYCTIWKLKVNVDKTKT
jgi:hypothetical protein